MISDWLCVAAADVALIGSATVRGCLSVCIEPNERPDRVGSRPCGAGRVDRGCVRRRRRRMGLLRARSPYWGRAVMLAVGRARSAVARSTRRVTQNLSWNRVR